MALHCCTGANMNCSMGLAPAMFSATPRPLTTAGRPVGHIGDHVPMLNIAPFGLCRSPSNPVVAAATAAAASPTPVPQPCVPLTAAPWSPGSPIVQVAGSPALSQGSTLRCAWGGTISFLDAGQALVTVA